LGGFALSLSLSARVSEADDVIMMINERGKRNRRKGAKRRKQETNVIIWKGSE